MSKEADELGTMTKCCIELYTDDSFLYRIINQTLRDNDKTKLDTLGPFSYLLKYVALLALYPNHLYERIVHRNVVFEDDHINECKNAINDENPKQWLAFSSTTKSRVMAEFFGGNTLFIIQLPINEFSFGIDISSYSLYFLRKKKYCCQLKSVSKYKRVKYDENKRKHLIYLNMNVLSDN